MARDSDHGVPLETPVAGTNKIVMTRIEVADMMRPTTQMSPLFGEGSGDEALVIEEVVPVVTGEHRAMLPRDSLVGLEPIDLRMSGLVPIDDRVSDSVVVADDLKAETVTSAPETRTLTNDSTAPLSLSQVEQDSMSAIARVNDAVLSGAIDGPLRGGAAAPVAVDTRTEETQKNRGAQTSLGVAPLEPATTVRAPFVIDTPVERWSPMPRAKAAAGSAPDLAEEAKAAGSNRMPPASEANGPRISGHERTAMLALDPASGMPRSGPWQALASIARSLVSVRWWRRRKTSRVKPIAR
ncbi:MAG: hypothetical protein ABJE66_15385 [Deltaproteobacteria bacterium]